MVVQLLLVFFYIVFTAWKHKLWHSRQFCTFYCWNVNDICFWSRTVYNDLKLPIVHVVIYLFVISPCYRRGTILVLCLSKRLNGLLFPVVLYRSVFHGKSNFFHPIYSLLLSSSFSRLCALWFARTFLRALSAFGGQTVCWPLWCLCRELVPWEQLFREQIVINWKVLEVCVGFLPGAPYFRHSYAQCYFFFLRTPLCDVTAVGWPLVVLSIGTEFQ